MANSLKTYISLGQQDFMSSGRLYWHACPAAEADWVGFPVHHTPRPGKARAVEAELSAHGPASTLSSTQSQPLRRDFHDAVDAMPPLVRRILIDGIDPSVVSVDSLLAALGRRNRATQHAARKEFAAMQLAAVLPREACAALRTAVDANQQLDAVSVDGLPEHQLCLTRNSLEALVGAEACGRLLRLAANYLRRDMRLRQRASTTGSQREAPSAAGPDGVDEGEGSPLLREVFIHGILVMAYWLWHRYSSMAY